MNYTKEKILFNLKNDNFSNSLGEDIIQVISSFEDSKLNYFKTYFRIKLMEIYQSIRQRFDLQYGIRTIAFQDTISMSDLPYLFHKYFIANSHPFGITLSVDQMGSDCLINQHVTVGSNRTSRRFDEISDGHKPKLGHFVAAYPGSVISGPISIGHFSIIGSNSIVSKDIPPFSFVTNVNEINPIKEEQMKTFLSILHHQLIVRNYTKKGLVFSNGEFYENYELTRLKSYFFEYYSKNKDFPLQKFNESAINFVNLCLQEDEADRGL